LQLKANLEAQLYGICAFSRRNDQVAGAIVVEFMLFAPDPERLSIVEMG
jgi:hypothetical protein